MLATNTAPVSLSSSLFSVTMCNPGSSPRLLTMSFHIMLLHTLSCSQQAVTQLLCLKVRPIFFAVNALAACIKVTGIRCLLSHQEIVGGGTTSTSLTTTRLIYPKMLLRSPQSDKWHFVCRGLKQGPKLRSLYENPGFFPNIYGAYISTIQLYNFPVEGINAFIHQFPPLSL